jgi:hypothetical protein
VKAPYEETPWPNQQQDTTLTAVLFALAASQQVIEESCHSLSCMLDFELSSHEFLASSVLQAAQAATLLVVL